MKTTELIKGQIYILTDERRNKRFELKYINVSKRGYSFRNMKSLSLHYLQQHSVNCLENK